MPSRMINFQGFRCQCLSILRLLFQKCSAAGPAAAGPAAAHNKFGQMAQKSNQRDSRSQPLAASAQRKVKIGLPGLAVSTNFCFFSHFIKLPQKAFTHAKTIQNAGLWKPFQNPILKHTRGSTLLKNLHAQKSTCSNTWVS